MNECRRGVSGVVCKLDDDKKDCDTCVLYKGIGIIPVIKRDCGEKDLDFRE